MEYDNTADLNENGRQQAVLILVLMEYENTSDYIIGATGQRGS